MKYLESYEKQRISNVSGLRKYFIDCLDGKWGKRGQVNRFAYFLQRSLDLTDLNQEEKNLNILEIGGGDGIYFTLNKNNIDKTIVDIDDHFKGILESKGIRFFQHDLSREILFDVDDNSFDLISMNHLIEHITDIDHFMTEVNRLLKSTGYVYIRTPDIKKVGFSFYNDFTHVRPFSKEGLIHMMDCYGLKKIFMVNNNNQTIHIDDFLGHKISGILPFGKEIEAVFKKKK